MNDTKLGETPRLKGERDAVHVATIAAVCGPDRLLPGTPVRVDGDGEAWPNDTEPHGVVDPFRQGGVTEGELVYVCLMPGTITGMRHHWQHPDLPGLEVVTVEGDRDESIRFLLGWCEHCWNTYGGQTPEQKLADLARMAEEGHIRTNGDDIHSEGDLPGDVDALKGHLEVYLGRRIDWADMDYSCAC